MYVCEIGPEIYTLMKKIRVWIFGEIDIPTDSGNLDLDVELVLQDMVDITATRAHA